MKKPNITIAYNEERLNAIRLFLKQKNLELDTELNGILDTIYKKHVPAPVRDFIELKDGAAPDRPGRKTSAL